MPASRAASSRTWVPKTSVWMNSPGASIERSTWVSAAKLTIASQPSSAAATASRSAMSATDQLAALVVEPVEVLAPAGVGELVEHAHAEVRMRLEPVADVGRADEPGPSGDEDVQAAALARLGRQILRQALMPVGKQDRVRSLAAEHRVGRARGGAGEHLRRPRHHPALDPGLVEDLLRELEP